LAKIQANGLHVCEQQERPDEIEAIRADMLLQKVLDACFGVGGIQGNRKVRVDLAVV